MLGRARGGRRQTVSSSRTGVSYLTVAASHLPGSATVMCSGHDGLVGPAWADEVVQAELDKQAAAAGNASARVALWAAAEALRTQDLTRLAAANLLIARAIADIVRGQRGSEDTDAGLCAWWPGWPGGGGGGRACGPNAHRPCAGRRNTVPA